MIKSKNIKAFSFTELIVVVTILAILSTIGFVSFSSYIESSRDTKRQSDISSIESALKLYKQKKWSYPIPWDSFNITNSGVLVAKQWKLNKKVSLSTLDTIPQDPKIKVFYNYSITKNKQDFQIAASLENNENTQTILSWDYKSVSKNVLPTIMLATWTTSDVEINSWILDWATNRNFFIFDQSITNLPYSFDWNNEPYHKTWVLFTELLSDAESKDYWQNSDYSSCLEIYESGKSIGDWEYQYLTWWTLQNINCIMTPPILN